MSVVEKIAYPDWTEYRKKNGLDPLGMQNSSVGLYQALLPGISNVTLRIRYYGLYAWLCWIYASRIGDTNPKTWQRFVRRAEALYALIAQWHRGETGVAGILWAQDKLATNADPIEFAADAEPGSPTYYLKQAWGAYGAAYASQLYEIGVFDAAVNHPIPVPTVFLGEPLAKAFSGELGETAERFFAIVDLGSVTRAELNELAAIAPSKVRRDSDEGQLYRNVLFARGALQRPVDLDRRRTLLLVLAVADHLRRLPDVNETRWVLYAGADREGRPVPLPADLERHRLRWWVYHANDLTHIAYETLLKCTLDVLEDYPSGITLPALIAEVMSLLADAADHWPEDWAAFLVSTPAPANALAAGEADSEFALVQTIMRDVRLDGRSAPETGWAALRLLAILHNRVRADEKDLREDLGTFDPVGFRSLLTEVSFLNRHIAADFTHMITKLIRERVVERHLWVAHRKFRYQGDYTFLLEADDGRVHKRAKDGPVFTNPRLGPAITFLRDLHLIGDDGLTKLGANEYGAL